VPTRVAITSAGQRHGGRAGKDAAGRVARYARTWLRVGTGSGSPGEFRSALCARAGAHTIPCEAIVTPRSRLGDGCEQLRVRAHQRHACLSDQRAFEIATRSYPLIGVAHRQGTLLDSLSNGFLRHPGRV